MSTRAERVAFLLDHDIEIGDEADLTTWLVDGRPANTQELAMLLDVTDDELADVKTLLETDIDLMKNWSPA